MWCYDNIISENDDRLVPDLLFFWCRFYAVFIREEKRQSSPFRVFAERSLIILSRKHEQVDHYRLFLFLARR